MTVLVIGGTPAALTALRSLAPPRLTLVSSTSAKPDWILVATSDQRSQAIAAYALPPYRVVEVPGLAGGDARVSSDTVGAALGRMAEVGPVRSPVSSLGVAIARVIVRRLASDVPATDAAAEATSEVVPPGTGRRPTTAGIPSRMPAGAQLDVLLASRGLERAKRFAAQAVRSTDRGSS